MITISFDFAPTSTALDTPLTFTSDIGEVAVTTDGAEVDCSIVLQPVTFSAEAFRNKYYFSSLPAGGGVCPIYGLRHVVDDMLLAVGESCGVFEVSASAGSSACIRQFVAVYCSRRMPRPATDLVAKMWFSPSSGTMKLCRQQIIRLSALLPPTASPVAEPLVVLATVQPADGSKPVTVSFSPENVTPDTGHYTCYIAQYTRQELAHAAAIAASIAGDVQLLSATFELGDRSATVFYSNRRPSLALSFANIFGLSELINVFGTIKEQNKYSTVEAVCGDELVQYDRQLTRSYAVEAAYLTKEAAERLCDAITAPSLQWIDDSTTPAIARDVIVTEMEIDPVRGSSDLLTAKFTLKLCDQMPTAAAPTADRIFTDPYNTSYN